jgi:hypothetical protein
MAGVTPPDRVWVGRDAIGGLMIYPKMPDHRQAVEYMRVLSRAEVDKLASYEGVDTLQLINSLHRTIDGQRKHIARLQRENREDSNDAAAEAGWKNRQGDEYGSY